MTKSLVPDSSDVRLLICDDYEPIRTMVRALVEVRPGLAVVGEAANGEEAVAEAARLQPDVILLDLAMPTKTGLQALQEIARVATGAKVIIFSGFSSASVARDVLDFGAVSYLQKGASPDAIIGAIEEAAREGASVAPPSISRQRGDREAF